MEEAGVRVHAGTPHSRARAFSHVASQGKGAAVLVRRLFLLLQLSQGRRPLCPPDHDRRTERLATSSLLSTLPQ